MYTIFKGKTKCKWCDKAAEILDKHNLPFTVRELDAGRLFDMMVVTSHPTVPMVFHGDVFLGGYTALQLHLEP